MILNTILCLLLLVNFLLLILIYRTVKSQPKHIGKDDLDMLQVEISKSEQEIRSEVRKTQDSTTNALTVQLEGVRTAFSTAQKDATDTLVNTIGKLGDAQALKLQDVTKSTSELTQSNEAGIEKIRETIDKRIQDLQKSNEDKLERMRQTVDEQLQTTLEKRLTKSFGVVSERLEVQQGLGKMQCLAADVGNLQRVLTNVSTRGDGAMFSSAQSLSKSSHQFNMPRMYNRIQVLKELSTPFAFQVTMITQIRISGCQLILSFLWLTIKDSLTLLR